MPHNTSQTTGQLCDCGMKKTSDPIMRPVRSYKPEAQASDCRDTHSLALRACIRAAMQIEELASPATTPL